MPFFKIFKNGIPIQIEKIAAKSYQFVVDVEFLLVYLFVKKELKEDEDGHSSLENQW